MVSSCSVRYMEKADVPTVLTWRNHDVVRRYMYTQEPIFEAEHAAWFDKASRDPRCHLLIGEQAGSPLGFVQFKVQGESEVATWGFYAVPGSPKGTGRKLANAALKHAFASVGFAKVYGEVVSFNHGSVAFHRALGFVQEGLLRQHYFDGRVYHSVFCFGMLATEWHNKQQG